jgi:hypothetical protein
MISTIDSIRVVQPLFPMYGQGTIPESVRDLDIEIISTQKAVELNRLWHSRLPIITNPFSKNTICFGAEYLNYYFACAIWTDPIARLFNGRNFLELRRMAISQDAPKNTASYMISIMVKTIKKEMPYIIKLISYQDTEVHNGTIYKASGWEISKKTAGGSACINSIQSWEKNKRIRKESQSTAYKIRWEKKIR